jgi:hypothetical protein
VPADDELRRQDDVRYRDLDRKVSAVAKDVTAIRDMLISEPEASPLGRALLARSLENRREIEKVAIATSKAVDNCREDFEAFLKDDFKPLNDWWNQSKGAWKFVLGASIVLGIVSTFFSVIRPLLVPVVGR